MHSSLVLAYVVRGVHYPTLRTFLDSCELAQQVTTLPPTSLPTGAAPTRTAPWYHCSTPSLKLLCSLLCSSAQRRPGALQVASLERNQLARVGAAQESEPSINVQGSTTAANSTAHQVHELAREEDAGMERAPMGGYPHNLDRLDQRSLPYDGRFEPLSGGAGTVVRVAVPRCRTR